MINYYLKQVRKCKDLLNDLRTDSLTKTGVCLSLQELLIMTLTKLENNIRKNKRREKEIKRSLADPSQNHNKSQSTKLKNELKLTKNRIDQYHYLRVVFKSFGDGIAFIFIDKYTLKPQTFKEGTGFISNKKGNRFERKCLRYALKTGGMAILNDLTNVLKYFDLTLIKDYNVWFPIELKSGKSRREIQEKKYDKLMGYLMKDIPTDVYNRGHEMTRIEHLSPIIDLILKVNSLIEKSRTAGLIIEKIEDGLTIVIGTNDDTKDLLPNLEKQGFVKPYRFEMNDYFINQLGYYPFCLSITSTDTFLDILTNKIQIIQILDFDYLERFAQQRGYKVEFLGEEMNYVRFTSLEIPDKAMALSYHYFGRIFFEFLSPLWFFNEQFDFLDNMEKIYADHLPEKAEDQK